MNELSNFNKMISDKATSIRISLTTIPNNETQFYASSHGPTDQIAKMLVAYLTYHPELLKKTFKGILDKISQDD